MGGIFALTFYYEINQLRAQFKSDHFMTHRIMLTHLASNLTGALFNLDEDRVHQQLKTAFSFGEVREILIFDDKGQLFSAYRKNKDPLPKLMGRKAKAERIKHMGTLSLRDPMIKSDAPEEQKIAEFPAYAPKNVAYISTLWYGRDGEYTFVGHVFMEFGVTSIEKSTSKAIFNKALSMGLLFFVLFLSIFVYLRKNLLFRLEKLHTAIVEFKNNQDSIKIDDHNADEIGSLVRAFRDMGTAIGGFQSDLQMRIKERTVELEASRDKIKTVLDTIDLGILSFDCNFCIAEEYSPRSLDLLDLTEDELVGSDIRDTFFRYLQLTTDQTDRFVSVMASVLGEDGLNWEANAHNLPSEGIFKKGAVERTMVLTWAPIQAHEDGIIKGVLLDIKDVTLERQLRRQQEEEHAKVSRAVTLIRNANRNGETWLKKFLMKTGEGIAKLRQAKTIDTQAAMMQLHTWKGEARTLNFKDLSSLLHQSETELKAAEHEQWRESLQAISLEISSFQNLFNEIFLTSDSKLSLVQVCHQLHQAVVKQLDEHGFHLASFKLHDEVGIWDTALLEDIVKPCLMHAVANSIDHGYINPMKIYRQSKPIELEIHARLESEAIHLFVVDRGFGLDKKAVLKKAAELGIDTSRISPEEIIFLPEFSTAQTISLSSGRGVGMSAIRELLQRINGQVFIKSEFGHGSCLTLIIPTSMPRSFAV